MRLAIATAVLIGTALVGGAHADGDDLVDTLGPREIALGEALRGGATGASAIALNPAGLPLSRDVVFEGGYGYRESDSASLVTASACDTTSAIPGCFYYDYAGANPALGSMSLHTSTQIVGTALAFPITPRVFLGTNMRYLHFDSDVMGHPATSGFNGDAGAMLRLTDLVNVGVAGYNLVGTDSVDFPRTVGGGVYAHPIPNLALGFDSRWKLEGSSAARYGGGAELFLRTGNGQTGFPIRAGALHDGDLDATYLSGGLGIASLTYAVDIAARHAISGAQHETLVIASMLFFGPRLPPLGPSAASD
jgi:hypothetical protein